MNWLISLLNLFGITPDKYPFLVLGLLIIAAAGYIRLSIGRTMGKMKDNILVIVTYLSTSAANRGKLDTSLIKMMSPMRITPQGYEALASSGFKAIFDIPKHRAQFMRYLQSQNPRAKLDVESFAIVSFATFLEKDFMNPIKAYLFNNPSARESYQTLAGLYVRDEYLKDHPEIIQ
jgi:hypothetical protein